VVSIQERKNNWKSKNRVDNGRIYIYAVCEFQTQYLSDNVDSFDCDDRLNVKSLPFGLLKFPRFLLPGVAIFLYHGH
jgi:hypothetical protein